ncbi:hypothetical protein PINS_up005638 [Pythium insidiosum]|nr:hypothetical protein PINS_up005638 [Pythium insidiosum]
MSSSRATSGGAGHDATTRGKRPLRPATATRSVTSPPPPPPLPSPPPAAASSARVRPLAIQRGAFSEHLLPNEQVVSSPTVYSRSGHTGASSSASATLLRSPTTQRAPQPAPTPPAPTLSPSLLLSPRAVSPTTKPQPSAPPPAPPRVDTKENVPLNPVDALAKKLRRQAAELSDVYEAMEKKEKDVDRLGRELRDVKRQLERQKTAPPPRAVTTVDARKATSARSTTTATKSSASSVVRRATLTATKAAASDVSVSDALQRLDASMKELRELHAELNDGRRTTAAAESTEDQRDSLLRQEQRLYIRVLEEAVHLKASELQITGHEELLVVLAELRHTIYEQERELRDAHERNQQLSTQCTNEKTSHTEKEQQQCTEIENLHRDNNELRAKTETLERQLHEAQRLVHHEVMKLRHAQTTQDAQQERIHQLEAEVRRSSETLQQSERRCERKTRELEKLQASLQSAQQETTRERERADSTQRELEKATRQVDELKALQESLLASLDKLVASEDASAQHITELQAELEQTAALKANNERLAEQVTALTEELERSKSDREDLRTQETQWNRWEALFTRVAPIADALQRQTDVDGDEIAQLRSAIQDADAPLWLASLVNALSSRTQELERARSSWTNERSDLRVTCQELERSTDLTMTELRRVQTQLLETQERLAMSEGEREHLQLEHLSLTEELEAAHAQLGLETALSQQLQHLEQIVALQKRRLHEVVKQNDELTTLETNLVVSLEAKDNQIAHLESRLSEHEDQFRRIQTLEDELEDAAALSEEQQNWNQQVGYTLLVRNFLALTGTLVVVQLTVELETMELERADSDQLVESLRSRENAVSTRVTTLFSQYLQAVSAREPPPSAKSSGHRPIRTTADHEEAMASGDVLQMLRVLPSLVDLYVAIAWARDPFQFQGHCRGGERCEPPHETGTCDG